MDHAGRHLHGEMTGANTRVIWLELTRRGIQNPRIRKKHSSFSSYFSNGRINTRDLTLLLRQIASMLQAGIPLVQTLEVIIAGTDKPKIVQLVRNLRNHVAAGNSLAASLAKESRYFNEIFCGLVAAGENSGNLDVIMDELAALREKNEVLKRRLKSALTYPVAVLMVAAIVTGILLIKVVPAFADIYAGFNSELPVYTQWVMDFAALVQSFWLEACIVLTVSVASIVVSYQRIPAIRRLFDRILLRLPIFGSLVTQAMVARITHTLATATAAGVPLVEALQSITRITRNTVFIKAVCDITSSVITGRKLHQAMRDTGQFPDMAVQLTAIGEESGHLNSMLSRIADHYRQQVDATVDNLTSLLEPVIMSVLGILIGGLIIAIYLPVFSLGQALDVGL